MRRSGPMQSARAVMTFFRTPISLWSKGCFAGSINSGSRTSRPATQFVCAFDSAGRNHMTRSRPVSSPSMPYSVQTPVFAGPFGLLLHLILRDEVDIYELSISAIVDAYLREIERMDELDLEIATEFLLIAATLVELKVKRLLPDESDIELDD